MATSTLGNGTLVLAGTTSGTTTVTATAVAGTTTLTLPAATDTLVGRATTDTLTNKTLTGAAMNGTVGATTPSTGAFTTLSASTSISSGTGNTTTAGLKLINGTAGFAAGWGAIYAENVTPSNLNFALATRWDGQQTNINTATGGLIINSVNNTEVTRVSSVGLQITNTVGVGNATPSSSGAGITFPATQSASSDANTLDDYEEGTWTPNQGGALTVVGTFSSSGSYTKVGNLLYVRGTVSGSTSIAITSIGNISTNLPFAVKSAAASIGTVTSTDTLTTFTGCYANATTTSLLSVNTVPATATIEFCVTYLT